MTDREFAVLEQRLAPVLAAGSSREYRREVEAILAECRALRAFAPPALGALERISWVFESLDSLRAEAGPDDRLVRKLRHHLATARGHLLAALRARPPGAEADHRAGDRELDKVLQDGAELERLREPPDAAGLMTAAGLAAVKGSFARHVYPRPDEVAALLAHIDALGSLARELYGVMADLHADDPGRQALLERGRAEGREQAAALAEEASAGWVAALGTPHEPLREVAVKVRALGPCRAPLPPSEAEREAGRLREALSAVVAARDCYDRYEVSLNEVYGAIDAARKALAGGGAP